MYKDQECLNEIGVVPSRDVDEVFSIAQSVDECVGSCVWLWRRDKVTKQVNSLEQLRQVLERRWNFAWLDISYLNVNLY